VIVARAEAGACQIAIARQLLFGEYQRCDIAVDRRLICLDHAVLLSNLRSRVAAEGWRLALSRLRCKSGTGLRSRMSRFEPRWRTWPDDAKLLV
jgi:hypothetical protein